MDLRILFSFVLSLMYLLRMIITMIVNILQQSFYKLNLYSLVIELIRLPGLQTHIHELNQIQVIWHMSIQHLFGFSKSDQDLVCSSEFSENSDSIISKQKAKFLTSLWTPHCLKAKETEMLIG